MEEPEVFERVLEEAESREIEPLVHVPEAHADRYEDVLSSYERHRITIAGRYPDIIGYRPNNEVIAIEVKGSKDLLKGVGQALTYQQGSHQSYLASSRDAVEGVESVAVSKGLGVISVDSTNDLEWQPPECGLENRMVDDISTQLDYHLGGYETAGKISSMSLSHPLNFLAPLYPLEDRYEMSKEEIEEAIKSEFGFKAVDDQLRGASVLGLINIGDTIELTPQGELTLVSLKGYGVDSLEDLDEVKKETSGKKPPLCEKYPPIATALRNLFLRHPEFRSFAESLETLRRQRDEVLFPELVEYLVENYPNVFLNLFCSRRGRERARELMESGESDVIVEDGVWRDVVRNNVLFNFLNHLKQMGFVSSETSSHGDSMSDYDPEEKPWVLGDTQ